MSHRTRLSLVAVLTAVLVPALAFADSLGNIGAVNNLTVYESGSDNYGAANGVVVVRERRVNGKPEELREYKWGGSLCPGRELSSTSIALLFEALRDRRNIKITPSYKPGNGSTRCLTGFNLDRT